MTDINIIATLIGNMSLSQLLELKEQLSELAYLIDQEIELRKL